jgi:hypothetical protein
LPLVALLGLGAVLSLLVRAPFGVLALPHHHSGGFDHSKVTMRVRPQPDAAWIYNATNLQSQARDGVELNHPLRIGWPLIRHMTSRQVSNAVEPVPRNTGRHHFAAGACTPLWLAAPGVLGQCPTLRAPLVR